MKETAQTAKQWLKFQTAATFKTFNKDLYFMLFFVLLWSFKKNAPPPHSIQQGLFGEAWDWQKPKGSGLAKE